MMHASPHATRPKTFSLGPWHVEADSRWISSGGTRRRLSPKAMAVLEILSEEPGRVLSREALLDRAWPDVTVGEEVLTHAIAELRRQLDDSARRPRFIETVHKGGYRLLQPATPEQTCPQHSFGELEPQPSTASIEVVAPDIYVRYLEASERYRRGGRSNLLEAVATYEGVVEDAPDFVHAHSGLAEALTFVHMYYDPLEDHLERALELARHANGTAPQFASTHAVLGLALATSGDINGAVERFGRALALEPENLRTHYLFGRVCFAEGNYATAAPLLAQAGRVRSDDFHMIYLAAKAYRGLGDLASARRLSRQALAEAETYLAYEPDDLRAACDRICCLVELGEIDRAQAFAGALVGTDDPIAYYLAGSLARAGEVTWALDCLETVVEGGWSHAGWLRSDPDLAPLHGEPRFQRVQRLIENA